ncbi:MAG: type IV secretion system protein [Alphaproteobacteria bacterium]|jgi:type IV secretory pathway component VirB8|nr:type IV secretion system protein [Alphaproteobacteria bacterium]
MANQLEGNNTQQKLIGGAARQPQRQARNEDVFVANVGEKRYLWTARAFAIITAISLCCNIVLILAIMQVLPLYRVEPFLLTFQNKEEQVYNIQPIKGRMEDQKAITEVFVRQYVLLRSSFDRDVQEMEARWMPGGPVQEMSSSAVYTEFLEKTAKKALDLIRARSLQRNVRILTVNELGRGLWQVEYETQDMYPDSPAPEVNYWTASLRIAYNRKSVKYGERLKNPVGFTVVRYSLTYNKVK